MASISIASRSSLVVSADVNDFSIARLRAAQRAGSFEWSSCSSIVGQEFDVRRRRTLPTRPLEHGSGRSETGPDARACRGVQFLAQCGPFRFLPSRSGLSDPRSSPRADGSPPGGNVHCSRTERREWKSTEYLSQRISNFRYSPQADEFQPRREQPVTSRRPPVGWLAVRGDGNGPNEPRPIRCYRRSRAGAGTDHCTRPDLVFIVRRDGDPGRLDIELRADNAPASPPRSCGVQFWAVMGQRQNYRASCVK